MEDDGRIINTDEYYASLLKGLSTIDSNKNDEKFVLPSTSIWNTLKLPLVQSKNPKKIGIIKENKEREQRRTRYLSEREVKDRFFASRKEFEIPTSVILCSNLARHGFYEIFTILNFI